MQQLYTGGVRMKKPLPIGVENFEDIIKSGYYYVDKTMFIKELHHFTSFLIKKVSYRTF